MEKFFVVTNQEFLDEVKKFKENSRIQAEAVDKFFQKHNISGNRYRVRGNGSVNTPFREDEKDDIFLFVEDCPENEAVLGDQLKKAKIIFNCVVFRQFKKSSAIQKEFQDYCIETQIPINIHWHREGDYFEELTYRGYSVTRFEHEGKYYMKIATSACETLTPIHEGFNEIKGSEFYEIMESLESKN